MRSESCRVVQCSPWESELVRERQGERREGALRLDGSLRYKACAWENP